MGGLAPASVCVMRWGGGGGFPFLLTFFLMPASMAMTTFLPAYIRQFRPHRDCWSLSSILVSQVTIINSSTIAVSSKHPALWPLVFSVLLSWTGRDPAHLVPFHPGICAADSGLWVVWFLHWSGWGSLVGESLNSFLLR